MIITIFDVDITCVMCICEKYFLKNSRIDNYFNNFDIIYVSFNDILSSVQLNTEFLSLYKSYLL